MCNNINALVGTLIFIPPLDSEKWIDSWINQSLSKVHEMLLFLT